MAVELKLLVWAAILGLAHVAVAAAAANRQRGLAWNLGPRDQPITLTGVAARLDRALANFKETFPIFAALVLAVGMSAKFNQQSALGCYLYLIGRVLYLPLYAFGVPVARTLAWGVALVGIILLIAAFFH